MLIINRLLAFTCKINPVVYSSPSILEWVSLISVQNKSIDILQLQGYDTISETKATGNLNEAEDEAEASVSTFATNMNSVDCLPMHKGSSLAEKSCHIPVQILFWTAAGLHIYFYHIFAVFFTVTIYD